ncbi:MAG: hypothetical protein AB7P17_14495 [Nitrospirales bacterium]|nr:hypothetical protein [Nitrospirales bacterium]
MSMIEWTVIIGGLTAIAWVNWYFFLAQAVADKQAQKNPEHPSAST